MYADDTMIKRTEQTELKIQEEELMYCKNCGNEIMEGAKFCSNCGSPVQAAPQPAQADETPVNISAEPDMEQSADTSQGAEAPKKKAKFEEFDWNVGDYPARNVVEKTAAVDFNWNESPADGKPTHYANGETGDLSGGVLTGDDLEKAVFGELKSEKPENPENMSAAERIDKFYTFNKKNEEFQKLLDREYNRVKFGNAIQQELAEADAIAEEKFENRAANSTMEDFLESEGIVKPYQPKAFESDVLQRIEAQEAEREAKRLAEEARLEAIEKARLEAEAKKKAEEEAARLTEIARKKAEEEAARLAEIAKRKAEEEAERIAELARKQAEEEAKAAELAKQKALEEEKLRAEEEARLRAEEEERLRVEEQARRQAEEDARIKVEAELKAAQEAAKLKAQHEARLAAEAEEKFKTEQQRRELAAREAQRRLEEERRRIEEEANQAVAQEEVRRVLEQTARMQKEEEEKIKAAVRGLKLGGSGVSITDTTSITKSELEAAHKATKDQIDGMAKARDEFFAEFEEDRQPVTGRETLLSGSSDFGRTRIVDKAAILSGIDDETKVMPRLSEADIKAAVSEEAPAPIPAPAEKETPVQETVPEKPAAEPTPAEPAPMDIKQEEHDELDDLLSQFESINDITQETEPRHAATEIQSLSDTIVAPHNDRFSEIMANDFDSYGEKEAAEYISRQAAQKEQDKAAEQKNEADSVVADEADDEERLSPKERKRLEKEKKRQEKEEAKAEAKAAKKKRKAGEYEGYDDFEDEKGGKGRGILKIILVILIVVLVVEIAGIGIKIFAGQSKAAEFIDTQLNKVIQLITGEDTEYSVIAAQVRTEPLEDKTDLINAQSDKNSGNIENIVYSAELSYDEKTDGAISDLVLSQPLTQVEWGRDEDNYPVYYDEQVVGTIIAFESGKAELMESGDKAVLNMIDKDSKLYKQTAKLKNKKTKGSFKKLEIGEIRQMGGKYCVWVKETIGDKSTEKVYSMYPEKQFEMKLASCYEI